MGQANPANVSEETYPINDSHFVHNMIQSSPFHKSPHAKVVLFICRRADGSIDLLVGQEGHPLQIFFNDAKCLASIPLHLSRLNHDEENGLSQSDFYFMPHL
jgi:hypothetical protein